MFWLHHPQPVRPRKAVAEQMVARTAVAPISTTLIVVEASAAQVSKTTDASARSLSDLVSVGCKIA